MVIKLVMKGFYPLITKEALEVVLDFQYINRHGCGMVYTIGGKLAVYEMHKNLMGRMDSYVVS